MSLKQRIILTISMLSYLLTAMSNSLVITGLTKIAGDLSLNQIGLSWVQNAYGLAFASFLLISGRLSDMYSRRLILNIALVIFLIGSLLSGLATNGAIMIGSRFLQGVGSALLAPTSMALLIDFFDGPALVKAIAWYSSVAGLRSSIGLILGGLFASLWTWRVGFYLNVPVCLIMIFLSQRSLKKSTALEAHEKLDLLGTITSVFGFGLLVFALNGAKKPLPMLGISLLILLVFVIIEHYNQHPVLPLKMFANWIRVDGYLCRLILNGAMLGYWFFISEYLQQIMHYSPLQVGFAYMPLSITLFIAAMEVPRLVNVWGDKVVLIIAAITMLIGFVFTLVTIGRGYWISVGIPMFIIGLGQGLALTPTTNMGIYQMSAETTGTASGLVNVAHQLGGVLGLALMVNIASLFVSPAKLKIQFWVAMVVGIIMMTTVVILAVFAGKEKEE